MTPTAALKIDSGSQKTICNPGKERVARPGEVAVEVGTSVWILSQRVKPTRFTVTPTGMQDP